MRQGWRTVASSVALLLASRAASSESPGGEAGLSPRAKRGAYLVQLGGCNDCHTPWKLDPQLKVPAPDMSRMLSGHPADAPDPAGHHSGQDMGVIGPTFTSFSMPFGVVYSPNLTPDHDTGLGTWTEKMFFTAMRKGRHLGAPSARPIFPPMPWPNLRHLSDEDLRAIFVYLRSIPAIRNPVPDSKVPEPVIEQMTASANALDRSSAGLPK